MLFRAAHLIFHVLHHPARLRRRLLTRTNIPFLIAFIGSKSHRNPTSASTNRGPEKRRFDPRAPAPPPARADQIAFLNPLEFCTGVFPIPVNLVTNQGNCKDDLIQPRNHAPCPAPPRVPAPPPAHANLIMFPYSMVSAGPSIYNQYSTGSSIGPICAR